MHGKKPCFFWRICMSNDDPLLTTRILYQDEYLAVVYKKIGEVCERESANPSLCLIENIRADVENKAGHSLPELEAVHRIDQPVSGCVLVALDKNTLATLSADFASGKIHKKYHAIVERPASGVPMPVPGTIEHMIRFDQKHHKSTVAGKEDIRKPGADWKKGCAFLETRRRRRPVSFFSKLLQRRGVRTRSGHSSRQSVWLLKGI